MNLTPQQINDLAKKYLEGVASEDEQRQLHEWYDVVNAGDIEVVLSKTPQDLEGLRKDILSDLKQMIAFDKEASREGFMRTDGGREGPAGIPSGEGYPEAGKMPSVGGRSGSVRRRYAVAACVVLLLGYGAYYLSLHSRRQEVTLRASPPKPERREVPPGGNRAILTLSNGSSIVLDSADNGELARQGNTRIVKLDNGQLAYRAKNGGETEILYNTMSTPRGGQYKLILPDGTAVWLNAASSIRYPTAFAGGQRQVDVTGEVYFEVRPDKTMPFIVVVNKTQKIEVLGTHFNVNAYADEATVNTTLLEGSVRVVQGGRDRRLEPGQQAQVGKDGEISIVRDVNTDATVAWKNGVFLFDHSSIQSVMRQLCRWYDMEVEYRGQVTGDLFGGDIRRSLPLTKVFHFLEKSQVHFSIEGNKIIVMP
ncbi:MAG: FecR domain-containing protein [Puia sp.]|nr:FecR domain-containing protein [Puia sp.]